LVSDIPAGDGKMANSFLQCSEKERGEGEDGWEEECEEELEGRAGSFKRNIVDIGRARRVKRERDNYRGVETCNRNRGRLGQS
jgi:hypothetical protein